MIKAATFLYRVVVKNRLFFAVLAVVVIAIGLTGISLSLYISSGASSLDLSRPGYSQQRAEVKSPPQQSFSATGPLDDEAADQFDELFRLQREALVGLGDFQDVSLDDASLQLEQR